MLRLPIFSGASILRDSRIKARQRSVEKERERTTEREDIKNETGVWRQRKIEREAWWERER